MRPDWKNYNHQALLLYARINKYFFYLCRLWYGGLRGPLNLGFLVNRYNFCSIYVYRRGMSPLKQSPLLQISFTFNIKNIYSPLIRRKTFLSFKSRGHFQGHVARWSWSIRFFVLRKQVFFSLLKDDFFSLLKHGVFFVTKTQRSN